MSFARYVDIVSQLNTVSIPDTVAVADKRTLVEYYLAATIAGKLDVGRSDAELALLNDSVGKILSAVNEYYAINIAQCAQQTFNFHQVRRAIAFDGATFTRTALGICPFTVTEAYAAVHELPAHPPLLVVARSVVAALCDAFGTPVDAETAE